MTESKRWTAGEFCWYELGTTDADGAKRFYGEMFGWDLSLNWVRVAARLLAGTAPADDPERRAEAIRLMKAAVNAAADGMAGQQQLAGDATLLFYMNEEAQEGRNAYVEKRPPDFGKFPRLP